MRDAARAGVHPSTCRTFFSGNQELKTPLEDIRVLDLSHALAGPYCSTMLADYGAQVIKIEPPGAGDISRAWGAPMPGGETA